ncbi:MAG: hypothetical protein ACRC9H_15405, partial [Aeromonas veronii]
DFNYPMAIILRLLTFFHPNAALLPIFRRKTAHRCGRRLNLTSQMAIGPINHCVPTPPSLWWQPN